MLCTVIKSIIHYNQDESLKLEKTQCELCDEIVQANCNGVPIALATSLQNVASVMKYLHTKNGVSNVYNDTRSTLPTQNGEFRQFYSLQFCISIQST